MKKERIVWAAELKERKAAVSGQSYARDSPRDADDSFYCRRRTPFFLFFFSFLSFQISFLSSLLLFYPLLTYIPLTILSVFTEALLPWHTSILPPSLFHALSRSWPIYSHPSVKPTIVYPLTAANCLYLIPEQLLISYSGTIWIESSNTLRTLTKSCYRCSSTLIALPSPKPTPSLWTPWTFIASLSQGKPEELYDFWSSHLKPILLLLFCSALLLPPKVPQISIIGIRGTPR